MKNQKNEDGKYRRGYKLISFDLDGTLLNDRLRLTINSKRGLKKIIKSGYMCIINSSRNLGGILPLIKKVGFRYLICMNGALVYDNLHRETIFKKNISRRALKKILNLIIKNKITANIFTAKEVFSTWLESGINGKYQKLLYPVIMRPGSLEKISHYNVLNIELIIDGNTTIVDRIGRKFKKHVRILNAGYNYFEIVDRSVDKIAALKRLLKKIRIDMSEVIAAGDSLSDYSLMKSSGFGLAMKNAHKKIIKIADAVTSRDNNNDGAVEFILKHFIK